jgi:hypothetical protein
VNRSSNLFNFGAVSHGGTVAAPGELFEQWPFKVQRLITYRDPINKIIHDLSILRDDLRRASPGGTTTQEVAKIQDYIDTAVSSLSKSVAVIDVSDRNRCV